MRIGFDLWGTLIEANPLFKERKKDLFQKHFSDITDVDFEKEMLSIKMELNNIINDSGWQPTEDIIMNLISTRFGAAKSKVYHFMEDYQRLAIIYGPLLIAENTYEILENLRRHELHIVSNTMFIQGNALREHLNEMGIGELFTYMFFSNTRGHSKPDRRIGDYSKYDYFIGDNLKVDGTYARRVGAEFIQINSNDKTLEDAYNIITSNG